LIYQQKHEGILLNSKLAGLEPVREVGWFPVCFGIDIPMACFLLLKKTVFDSLQIHVSFR
jgi:hypothetical protein